MDIIITIIFFFFFVSRRGDVGIVFEDSYSIKMNIWTFVFKFGHGSMVVGRLKNESLWIILMAHEYVAY